MAISRFSEYYKDVAVALARLSDNLRQIESTSGDLPTRFLDVIFTPGGSIWNAADAIRKARVEGLKAQAFCEGLLVNQFNGGAGSPATLAELNAALSGLGSAANGFATAVEALWAQVPARVRSTGTTPAGVNVPQFAPSSVIPAALADQLRAHPSVATLRAALTTAGVE